MWSYKRLSFETVLFICIRSFWDYLYQIILSIRSFWDYLYQIIFRLLNQIILSIRSFLDYSYQIILRLFVSDHFEYKIILRLFVSDHFEIICIRSFWDNCYQIILRLFVSDHFEIFCIWSFWYYFYQIILRLFVSDQFEILFHLWRGVHGVGISIHIPCFLFHSLSIFLSEKYFVYANVCSVSFPFLCLFPSFSLLFVCHLVYPLIFFLPHPHFLSFQFSVHLFRSPPCLNLLFLRFEHGNTI